MSLSPITIATRGYVCGAGPGDLSVALQGYECLSGYVPPYVPPVGGGAGRPGLSPDQLRELIAMEDEEIMTIISMALRTLQ